MPVSVNIGVRQLQQNDFAIRVAELLALHPYISPDLLELEITETTALKDVDQAIETMKKCREMGIQFALDDFGTGYSSLAYLKRLPVNVLKIDRYFVREMLNDPEEYAIIMGVIGISTAFRHTVIAEGVESKEQGEMLMSLGCDLAQGYAISRPIPGSEIESWAVAWAHNPVWKI